MDPLGCNTDFARTSDPVPNQVPLDIIELRDGGSLLYFLGDLDQRNVLRNRQVR